MAHLSGTLARHKTKSVQAKHFDMQNRIVNATASTLTVTRHLHEGRLVTLNRAAGIAVTMPEATGSGDVYEFFVGTTVSSNTTVIAALTTDIIQGVLSVSTDAAGVAIPTAADSDKITMNGSTTGGVIGSYVKLVDAKDATWLVSGALVSTGVEATPFGSS